ncbi:MAG: cytochrome c, partial [Acidobacteriota bacterium]
QRRHFHVALVEALWRRARPAATPSLPAWRPARGGELFVGLGCGACHVAGEARSGFAGGLEEADELRRGWLGAFLLDGHRPRLRLDPSEAADVAAYLTPDPPDGGDSAGPDGPSIDPAIRDRLLLAALETETTIEGAQAAFEALDDGERTLRLADHLLERYACAACHRLSGLEAPPLEGSFRLPASEAARDWLAALGSGGAGAPDARDVHADVTSPSSGAYDLSAEEWLLLEAVSLRPNPARAAAAPRSAAEAGRQVVARPGCRACHEVESAGGDLAPSLDRAAPRLQSTWVASVLTGEAPPVRHWFEVRMPDFELTAGEVDAAVADLARMAGQTRTALRGPSPSRRDLAVGKAAFEVLQCGRCHGTGPEAAVVSSAADDGWEGLLPVVLAPDYRWSRERLRSDWLREYVRGPRALDPQSTLPGIFPELEGGRADSSYLLGALGTPMFHLQQLRLLQHFEDDLDLARHLSEPDEVAAGLAAYVESLEPPG